MSFFLASLCPAILLGLRAIVVRRVSPALALAIDLGVLIVSMPIGMWLVGWVEDFPEYAGDHNPGIGIAFYLLLPVWFGCFAVWLVRGLILIFRSLSKSFSKP